MHKAKVAHFWPSLLCLLPACLLVGCAAREPTPVRLVLISPHRDEVREEVGRAFRDWFRTRTQSRTEAARQSLQRYLDSPEPAKQQGAVTEALRELLHDWSPADQDDLATAFALWSESPSPEHTHALLGALDRWQGAQRPVELVWQDIGGGTSQIARYVGSQFEQHPDGIGIDLLFGGGTDIYLRFSGQGLLQRIELPRAVMARIRPQLNGVPLYDPEGRWYGPMLSSFGILSNRRVLANIGQPVPRHWADLGEPGLRGWVSAGDPRLTGSVHMVYEIILQGHGWEDGFRLLLRLGANTHTFIRDSGTLTRAVTEGEVAAAGNLDANALPALAREPDLMTFQLPAGETIINPDAIAVLKGAPRPELARAFVEFTLSDAGQLLFLLQPGQPGGPRRYALCRLSVIEELYARYPPAVRSVGDANPFAVRNLLAYGSNLGNGRWDALNDLFGAVIVDAHPDLAAAWKVALESRLPEPDRKRLEDELFRPPCSEAELAAYGRDVLAKGPRLRAETVNRWGEEARQRYRRVRREAEGRY
jgi:iron(III) transport system substrate-binding protein